MIRAYINTCVHILTRKSRRWSDAEYDGCCRPYQLEDASTTWCLADAPYIMTARLAARPDMVVAMTHVALDQIAMLDLASASCCQKERHSSLTLVLP